MGLPDVQRRAPWWEMLAACVFVLGALQIVAGAVLCLVGAENVGQGLISEGVSDISSAVMAFVAGSFDIGEWAADKVCTVRSRCCVLGVAW